jgi:hypothetical protein
MLKLIAEKLCVVNLSLMKTLHLFELISATILLSIALMRVRAIIDRRIEMREIKERSSNMRFNMLDAFNDQE